jgi:hypothetical protein
MKNYTVTKWGTYVFSPNRIEFQNGRHLIQTMLKIAGPECGIIKMRAPPGLVRPFPQDFDFRQWNEIETITQTFQTELSGAWMGVNKKGPNFKCEAFVDLAKASGDLHFDEEGNRLFLDNHPFLEDKLLQQYLKLLYTDDDPPLVKKPLFKYGPDIPQSLFETLDKKNPWNLNRFPGCILREEIPQWLDLADPDMGIPGITSSFCYIGTAGSLFFIHTEDGDLAAVNYNWDGAPKFWIGPKPKHTAKFEKYVGSSGFKTCK